MKRSRRRIKEIRVGYIMIDYGDGVYYEFFGEDAYLIKPNIIYPVWKAA